MDRDMLACDTNYVVTPGIKCNQSYDSSTWLEGRDMIIKEKKYQSEQQNLHRAAKGAEELSELTLKSCVKYADCACSSCDISASHACTTFQIGQLGEKEMEKRQL